MPCRAATRGVLDGDAAQIRYRRGVIEDFDEVVCEESATIAAASVDLADNQRISRGAKANSDAHDDGAEIRAQLNGESVHGVSFRYS